jgi:hypothetical protein
MTNLHGALKRSGTPEKKRALIQFELMDTNKQKIDSQKVNNVTCATVINANNTCLQVRNIF